MNTTHSANSTRMQQPSLKPPGDRYGAQKYVSSLSEGNAVVNGSQDLEKRLLVEAQAAHQAVARLDAELQEEQPLNIATFQENLDVSLFSFYILLTFTVAFQLAQRELKGLQDQLTDAQTRHLRLQGQAGPLVKTLDSVRRKIETYEAQKNQLQVC